MNLNEPQLCDCCGRKGNEFVAKSKMVCKNCRYAIDWYVALVCEEASKRRGD